MRFIKAVGASAAAVAAVTSMAAAPAQAAYPTTTFARMSNNVGGYADITVTWYNRSVQISGRVYDPKVDSYGTVLAFEGTDLPNHQSSDSDGGGSCYSSVIATNGSKSFSYNCAVGDSSGENTLIQSVWAQIGRHVTTSGAENMQGQQTKNRPS